MTEITQTVREQAFLPMTCDIPQGMTLAQYRSQRPPREARARRRRIRRPQLSTK
jgi:hypothetical protein